MTARPFSDIPGPQGPDMLRSLRLIRRDALAFLAQCAERYGPVVQFPIPRTSVVFVADPEAVRRVLQTNHRNYGKRTIQYDSLALLTGEGLLVSDGEVWRVMRRVMQPAFHHETLAGVLVGVERSAQQLLDEWDARGSAEQFDLDEAMMRTTLQVVGATLFGADLADDAAAMVAAVVDALDVVVARAQQPVPPPSWLPTPGNVRLRRSLRALDAAVDRLLAARRQQPPGDDVMALLLRAHDEGLATDRQVRDEVVTLIVAGHETVAATMTWTWLLLAGDDDVRTRLAAEAAELPDGPLTLEHLDALTYTRAVVDESLRLYPPAWLISRRALAADELAGFRIPAGTIVIMSPYLVHRAPDLWPEPERFDPDRFLGERRGEVQREGYLPFGAGPRLCIGRDLALLEATLLTALIARRYDVVPVAPDAVVPHPGVTIRPTGGLPATVTRR